MLVPNSVGSVAYAAAVAARIGAGFASDVFALDVQGGEIVATRAGYGAKVNMEVGFPGKPVAVLTLRGATMGGFSGLSLKTEADWKRAMAAFEGLLARTYETD